MAMVSYRIEHAIDGSFQVDVCAASGTRHRIPGFSSESEAQEWIDADQRRKTWLQPATFLLGDAD
jgi:hypothetical protein